MTGRRAYRPPDPESGEPTQLRVIGGDLRGRKFSYSGDARTRPMKERVRESVFSLLGFSVRGAWALDLFAGTGALGIEALSRGAAQATFLEQYFPTAKLLKENIRALELEARAEVHAGDTFIWLRRFTGREGVQPWIVFCAPPYEFYVSRRAELLGPLTRLIELAPPGSHFVVECDERFDVSLLPRAEEWDVREYLPAIIGIYEKVALPRESN
jgi:16S rRNA (guanine966-N2)-methyltransferase